MVVFPDLDEAFLKILHERPGFYSCFHSISFLTSLTYFPKKHFELEYSKGTSTAEQPNIFEGPFSAKVSCGFSQPGG